MNQSDEGRNKNPGEGRWRAWRWLLSTTLVLLVVGAAERGFRAWQGLYALPTRGAEWIWAPPVGAPGEPRALFLLRDFDLSADDLGRGQALGAEVLVAGDEEYLLYLNGKRVSSGRFDGDRELSAVDVSEILELGRNRFVAELRSERGDGGLLLALFLGDSEWPTVRSDGSWQALVEEMPGLISGYIYPPPSARAQVWRRPVVGRWQRPLSPASAPRKARLTDGLAMLRRDARPLSAEPFQPLCGDVDDDAERLVDGGERTMLFDFGAPLYGYLEIVTHESRRTVELGLGTAESPLGMCGEWQEVRAILATGQSSFRDAMPRHFRYLRVRGEGTLADIVVDTVDAGVFETAWRHKRPTQPLWGLHPESGFGDAESSVLEGAQSGSRELGSSPAEGG